MSKHYLCTGSCGAVISEEDYNKGLKVCGAPRAKGRDHACYHE